MTGGSPPGSRGRAKRVLRTGLALVHEGELVFPAAGSEAAAERVARDAAQEIHYHFPIEVEVRRANDAREIERAIDEALAALADRLQRSG